MPHSGPTLCLPLLPRKDVAVDWDGGEISSDGGGLLLRLADRKLRLPQRLAEAEGGSASAVYRFYSARGDRKNRIQEFKLDMDGGRLSCTGFQANQFRLILHTAAYLLYQALQVAIRAAAPQDDWARAQVATLRSRCMKVAARVRERCRVVRVHLCSSFPHRALWTAIARQLLAGAT